MPRHRELQEPAARLMAVFVSQSATAHADTAVLAPMDKRSVAAMALVTVYKRFAAAWAEKVGASTN